MIQNPFKNILLVPFKISNLRRYIDKPVFQGVLKVLFSLGNVADGIDGNMCCRIFLPQQ